MDYLDASIRQNSDVSTGQITCNFLNKKKKDDVNASLRKRDITFVNKLKETRARLNASQKEVGKIVGASVYTLSSFERFTMSPANWRKWQEKINPWVKKPILPSQNERIKTRSANVSDKINRHMATFEVDLKKDQQPSSKIITQLAKTTGLEETSVNRWFKRQRYIHKKMGPY